MIPHDHSDILERVWTQFQNSPRMLAVLARLLVAPANEAEALLELTASHNIVEATGLALDDIGALLDLTRAQVGNLHDDEYRFALIIRARSVFAGGTIPDFTDLLRAILPLYPSPIPVIEWFPASVRVYLGDITAGQADLLQVLLRGVLPAAGVNTVIAVHGDTCVTFSSSHGPVTLLGWLGSSHGATDTQAGWAHALVL
jgi:hypothetical protein